MVSFKIQTVVKRSILCTVLITLFWSSGLQAQIDIGARESKYWRIDKVNIPEEIVLEVGGLAFDNQGNLGVSTRRGEIWVIENPGKRNAKFNRFASGLHEPLGLAFRDGSFYCSQRGELSKITDTNDDGTADSYETVYTWPLAANYHEYSYGPVLLPNNDMLVTLNLAWTGRGESLSKWRGWMLKITPDGEMTPIATGMRSPAGFGINKDGDIFFAENQGDWVGSGRITHIESGVFAGHPEGLKWTKEEGSPLSIGQEDIIDTLGLTLYEYGKKLPAVRPPSVWFPHTIMGISTSDILLLDKGNFGPFEGQLLIGDQGHSKIMRVFQEKVKGVYQGACFAFKEGFSSGVLRLEHGKDNSIYVGMTSRGWASTGKDPYGLERLVPTGRTPFEMKTIKAMPDGFEIEFTQALKTPEDVLKLFSVNDFTYKYHHNYGSPVIDQEEKTIQSVDLSEDKKTVRLYIDGLREGYIYEIKSTSARNEVNEGLLHNVGYYTLNNIPDGAKKHTGHTTAASNSATDASSSPSEKRVITMPEDWGGNVDQEIVISTIPGLKFDKDEIKVKAGSKIKFTFDNPDDMLHNLILVNPGKADEVAQAAIDLGLKGQEKGYVPDSDEVLYHTSLLEPKSNDIIYFKAPAEPGEYTYVCTFPGHAFTMRGKLIVE